MPPAFLVFLLAALVLAAGCAVFPEGTYWPAVRARVPTGEGAERLKAPPAKPRALGSREAADRQETLQANLTRRWSSDGLARSALGMSGAAGRLVYAEAMGLVVGCYVDPVRYRDLVASGLESLRAALDNAKFRERFPETADEGRRARFARALEILALKARAADPWFSFQAADWLAVALEKNRALLGLPDGAVVTELLFGAMDSLDPYSRFITTEMRAEEAMHESYVGIGVQVVAREGRLFIQRVFEGAGAARAGLKIGDEILEVDGKTVAGPEARQWIPRLRGEAGTRVTLTIRPAEGGEPCRVTLVRARLKVPSVEGAQRVDRERGVGYVRLAQFTGDAPSALRAAIDTLRREGMKSLVLDLRDNPGGELGAAVQVAGLFLAGGRVTETRGRMLGASWKYDVPIFARRAWTGPLAVLVNGNTASAAEVVATALGQRGRAGIVGRRTFGKGAAQIDLPVDWGLYDVCVTVARVYGPDKEGLEGRGVKPAVEVPEASAPPRTLQEDPDVRAAMARLASESPAP